MSTASVHPPEFTVRGIIFTSLPRPITLVTMLRPKLHRGWLEVTMSLMRGGTMDWLGVVTEVHAQIATYGEAYLPWTTVERAGNSISRSPTALMIAKSLGEDLSPIGMLKRLAEKEGNLDFTIDLSSNVVHLVKPSAEPPVARPEMLKA